jgi:hypothetical protein
VVSCPTCGLPCPPGHPLPPWEPWACKLLLWPPVTSGRNRRTPQNFLACSGILSGPWAPMRGFHLPGYPKGTLHSTSLKNLQNSRCWDLKALRFHVQDGDPPVPFIGSPQSKLEPTPCVFSPIAWDLCPSRGVSLPALRIRGSKHSTPQQPIIPAAQSQRLRFQVPRLAGRRDEGRCLAMKVCAGGAPIRGSSLSIRPAKGTRGISPCQLGHSATALTSLARAAAAASGSRRAPSFPSEDGGMCRETTHSSVWQPGCDSGCSALKQEEEEDEEEEEETAQSDAICCTPLRIHWLPGASPGAAGRRAAGSHLAPSLPQQLLRCPSLMPSPPPSSLLLALLPFSGLVHPSDPRTRQTSSPGWAAWGATGLNPLGSSAPLKADCFPNSNAGVQVLAKWGRLPSWAEHLVPNHSEPGVGTRGSPREAGVGLILAHLPAGTYWAIPQASPSLRVPPDDNWKG